ncbi:hypothetical protein G9A89_012566 [Geosiphon pyriformis]|nr:hypothetical protein G9A89_012566 [Geosiphon pyriformis]
MRESLKTGRIFRIEDVHCVFLTCRLHSTYLGNPYYPPNGIKKSFVNVDAAPVSKANKKKKQPKKKTTKKILKKTSKPKQQQKHTTPSSSSGLGGLRNGQGTYYNPGLGACGFTDNDNSAIVALGSPLFDQYTPNGNPNNNSLCGKRIRIEFEGKSVEGTVHDRCPECAAGDVDMSPSMFKQIADQGRVDKNPRYSTLSCGVPQPRLTHITLALSLSL